MLPAMPLLADGTHRSSNSSRWGRNLLVPCMRDPPHVDEIQSHMHRFTRARSLPCVRFPGTEASAPNATAQQPAHAGRVSNVEESSIAWPVCCGSLFGV